MDKEWKFTYINKEAERQLGKSKGQLIGKSIWTEYANPPEQMTRAFTRAMEEQVQVQFEVFTQERWRDFHIYPWEAGLSVYLKDITNRKQMEQDIARLDRLNLIGEMAAGISHEVRNPMTTVRGFLQMLSEKNGCIQYEEYFKIMIEELDRANSIITEFLSISKVKSKELVMQSLNPIIEALYPLIQADAVGSDKYVKIELGVIPDLMLDDKEIRQVILNLAGMV
ncbi:hypothetical protein N752_14945 [Desulforamulus aquiferis]|nr:histidine kinase dimerization/phospho-acceptor domain-containing protein [Desulforamulus aquiferis]RYD04667.1 hypothetical protein N752_14945 [Desulforamulus aquiferis]